MHPFFLEDDKMEKIKVGQLVNTHGIQGECKVRVLTEFAEERFAVGQQLWLCKGAQTKQVTVSSTRWQNEILLVRFKELKDMTGAEAYKGFEIMIDIDQIEALDEGFYAFELVGYQVFDEHHQLLGHVKRVEETGANDVLRVSRDEKKDLLVPFVDAFIQSIDEEATSIVIHMMEGLE